jgi:hypothetical protein
VGAPGFCRQRLISKIFSGLVNLKVIFKNGGWLFHLPGHHTPNPTPPDMPPICYGFSISRKGLKFCGHFMILTLLVPGVDSSHVPGFFREFVFFRFYTIMAKLLEINHIYLER